MASINAWRFANKLSEAVRKNEIVFLGDVMRDSGYAESTCKKPYRVLKSPYFQKLMQPLADKLQSELDRIIIELAAKDISKERYDTLVQSYERLFKIRQLATGGSTENNKVTVELSEVLANKRNASPSTTEGNR